jgi:hypothetical protein
VKDIKRLIGGAVIITSMAACGVGGKNNAAGVKIGARGQQNNQTTPTATGANGATGATGANSSANNTNTTSNTTATGSNTNTGAGSTTGTPTTTSNSSTPTTTTTTDDAKKAATTASKGGEPGDISILGAVVKFDSQNLTFSLDSHLSTSLVNGAAADGSKPTSDKKATIDHTLPTTAATNDGLANDKTYIALGCNQQVDKSLVDGLTQASIESSSVTVAKANTVVLCDTVNMPAQGLSISADRVVMIKASLSLSAEVGSISIDTNSLELQGESTIKTNAGSDVKGPDVSLIVRTKFTAADNSALSIETEGGSAAAAADTAAKTEKAAAKAAAVVQK